MKTIIAGSREGITKEQVYKTIKDSEFDISAVLCGEARGVDAYGKQWALEKGIEVISYPADWDKYGKAAGPIRNKLMAENAEALIAVWDGYSRGTSHMINLARSMGLEVYVQTYI